MYRMFLEEYDLADSNNRACFLDTEAGDRSVEFYFHLIFLLFSLSPLCSYNKQKDFTKGSSLTLFHTALFCCVNMADISCEFLHGVFHPWGLPCHIPALLEPVVFWVDSTLGFGGAGVTPCL